MNCPKCNSVFDNHKDFDVDEDTSALSQGNTVNLTLKCAHCGIRIIGEFDIDDFHVLHWYKKE